jgi:hypothetical protein
MVRAGKFQRLTHSPFELVKSQAAQIRGGVLILECGLQADSILNAFNGEAG